MCVVLYSWRSLNVDHKQLKQMKWAINTAGCAVACQNKFTKAASLHSAIYLRYKFSLSTFWSDPVCITQSRKVSKLWTIENQPLLTQQYRHGHCELLFHHVKHFITNCGYITDFCQLLAGYCNLENLKLTQEKLDYHNIFKTYNYEDCR